MYIDTHSKESMESSVCQLLRMHPLELREQLMLIDKSASDDDDYIAKLDQFIDERVTDYPDEILLFHLARRLHGTEDETEGRNLADLAPQKILCKRFSTKSRISHNPCA